MPFRSILIDSADTEGPRAGPRPEVVRDLHLDQIIGAATSGFEEYRLDEFFHAPLATGEAVRYRHDVFHDLENRAVYLHVGSFSTAMRVQRERIAKSQDVHHPLQKQRWFLDAVDLYCEAVVRFAGELAAADLASKGLTGLREYLAAYVQSEAFTALSSEARQLETDLAAVRYGLYIDGSRIEVRPAGGGPEYGEEIERIFAKFARDTKREYRFKLRSDPEVNHVEAAILERVALLYPQLFGQLAQFVERYRDPFDPTLVRFDREVQFYAACLEHAARLKAAGLEFCYPEVTDRSKAVFGEAMFDLALAAALVADGKPVVTNDFHLEGPERILVVSGANQGGKTTFARAFGQMHYLASLGCPVPGRRARLYLFDAIYTHFEREEAVETLSGKLEDELVRMHRILDAATPRSILIMNESFGSTTLDDALYLGERVMRRIIERDMLGVCVTFLDELASLDRATVSMVSQVNPHDPAERTFKVVRAPANGLAHALAIAKKYRLSYEQIRERMAP